MSRPGSGSPWHLILPWSGPLLGAAFLIGSLACGGAPPPEPVPIPHPPLDAAEAAAREQIEAARHRLESTRASGALRGDTATASGELGRLYQGYGYTEAALAAYSNAVALAPDELRWLYHLGALELESGSLAPGKRHLERALEVRPGDAPTLRRLGQAALDEAEFERAADLYSRAAEAEPGCAAAHFGAGLAALGQRDHQRAVEAFEHTLQIEPAASQTYRPLAMAYRALGQTERARRSLALAGTAVATCPDPLIAEIQELVSGASALFERATLADLEGRSEVALALARQAVETDPAHAAARRLYGQLLTRTGDFEAAIDQLEAAAGLEPGDRRTHMLLGRAYRSARRLEASAAALERAVELDPRYSRARVELALSLMEIEEWEAARSTIGEGLAADPGDLDLRVQLARTLAATGDLGASRRELEVVVERDPSMAAAHLALGAMLLEAGQPADAEEHLAAVLQGEANEETSALAHFQLARLAAARGDDAIARQHLESAVDLSPTLVEARLALAESELAVDRPDAAGRLFAEAATMRPDLPQPLAGQARALLRAGRHLDARRKLEDANQAFPRDPMIAHLLARLLATAPAPRVRDGQRALELASGLFAAQKTIPHGETVAMALAETGRWEEAVAWQRRLLEQARTGDTEPEALEQLESRLADYERRRPARVVW